MGCCVNAAEGVAIGDDVEQIAVWRRVDELESLAAHRPVAFLHRLPAVPTRRRIQLPVVRRDAARRHLWRVRRRDETGSRVCGRRRTRLPVPASRLRPARDGRGGDAANPLCWLVVVALRRTDVRRAAAWQSGTAARQSGTSVVPALPYILFRRWWLPRIFLPRPTLRHKHVSACCDQPVLEVGDDSRFNTRWTVAVCRRLWSMLVLGFAMPKHGTPHSWTVFVINVKNFHGSLTTVVRAQNDTLKTANITDTIFARTYWYSPYKRRHSNCCSSSSSIIVV